MEKIDNGLKLEVGPSAMCLQLNNNNLSSDLYVCESQKIDIFNSTINCETQSSKPYSNFMTSDPLNDNSTLELDVKPLTLSNSSSVESITQSFNNNIPVEISAATTIVPSFIGEATNQFSVPNTVHSNNPISFISSFSSQTNPTFMYHHHPISNGTILPKQSLPSMPSMFSNSMVYLPSKMEPISPMISQTSAVVYPGGTESLELNGNSKLDCKLQNTTPDSVLTCAICHDKASGKHYGVISCEGCKGFFKRTVRKQLTYMCRESGQCPVDRRKRTRCQHCRFEQCLSKGMRREAVQEERHRHVPLPITHASSSSLSASASSTSMLCTIQTKSDSLKRICNRRVSNSKNAGCLPNGQSQVTIPATTPDTIATFTSDSANFSHQTNTTATPLPVTTMPVLNLGTLLAAELSTDRKLSVSDKGESIYEDIPDSSDDSSGVHPLIIICQSVEQQLPRLVNWARQLPVFSAYLNVDDQFCLIKAAWPELILISAVYHSTAVKDGILLSNGRHLGRKVAKSHGLGPLVDRILLELIARFRDLTLQRTELALLRVIILFNPDANGLSARHRVESVRENLYAALHSYCITNQPQDASRFTKLLLRLPPLRSISYKCLEHLVFVKLAAEDPTSRRLINLVEHGVWPVQDDNTFLNRPASKRSQTMTKTTADEYPISQVVGCSSVSLTNSGNQLSSDDQEIGPNRQS